MSKQDRRVIVLDGRENSHLHAAWSRSGKHLIVTVSKTAWSDGYQQVELRPDQLEELRDYLSETIALNPPDR